MMTLDKTDLEYIVRYYFNCRKLIVSSVQGLPEDVEVIVNLRPKNIETLTKEDNEKFQMLNEQAG
jgi:hypothetical protein